jgi:hypothetical protein
MKHSAVITATDSGNATGGELMRRSLLVVSSVVLILGACGGDDSDPSATIESYIEA